MKSVFPLTLAAAVGGPHRSTLVTSAGPNAMPKTEESSIIIFCTLFHTDHGTSETAL